MSSWEAHDAIVQEHRRRVANAMEALWRDAMQRMPDLDDDPYVVAIFNSARDSHARLFDLLHGLTGMLERMETRSSASVSASARPNELE